MAMGDVDAEVSGSLDRRLWLRVLAGLFGTNRGTGDRGRRDDEPQRRRGDLVDRLWRW